MKCDDCGCDANLTGYREYPATKDTSDRIVCLPCDEKHQETPTHLHCLCSGGNHVETCSQYRPPEPEQPPPEQPPERRKRRGA